MPSDRPRLEDFLTAVPVAAILLRNNGVVAAVNDNFLDEFAIDDAYAELIVGAHLDDLGDSFDATVIEPLRDSLGVDRLTLKGVLLWRHGATNGERFDISISRIDRDFSIVTFSAISGARGSTAELRRLQRLACLGMAASGIAHDLNNHLSATMNTASLLADELGAESGHARALQIIVGSAEEAADLARKLLAFAGRGQPQIRRLDLRQIVDDAALLVRHELPRDGRIQFDFAADDSALRGDATQVEHAALLLLLRTARRLDPAQGATVRTRTLEFTEPAVSSFGRRLAAGAYVALEFRAPVSDSPPLGSVEKDDILATVDAIAYEHGGALRVSHENNEENAEILLRPDRRPQVVASTPALLDNGSPSGRAILVVDDDDMVRDVAVAMVRRLGFAPIAASSGYEAIAAVRAATPPVDLVILDLVMGDMDGLSALRAIRKIAPDVKVVVSSGYTTEASTIADERVDAVLEKPYTLNALKQTLADVLGE
jgi:CheY-like chemotaxis protein/nitrogen-specific signal transduction histidine kinase